MWRGVSSGGRNTPDNWKGFHRHRFVACMNASAAHYAYNRPGLDWPPLSCNVSGTQTNSDTVHWLNIISDVGFTKLSCYDRSWAEDCLHTAPHFATKKKVSMVKQFQTKYLPDIDGHGFSGRYLAFLRSTSMPIKATIYSEWHDTRLVPWYHFVPMQNSFVDLYGILEYFVGRFGREENNRVIMEDSHDDQARRIATQGKEWAETVLRREDMLVYLLRLLLEYRRICEDRRDSIGWIKDLI